MSHAAPHAARPAHADRATRATLTDRATRATRAARPARATGATRASLTDRVETTQRWAIGVLAVATVLLGVYLALLVTATWLFASVWGGLTRDPVSVDLLSVVADVAPGLLVGWCTGLATSAVLGRGDALGARAAGIAAGALGATLGAAVLALTGLA